MKNKIKLKKSTHAVIKKIAVASSLTEDEVIRRIMRSVSADGVATHLSYGLDSLKGQPVSVVTNHRA